MSKNFQTGSGCYTCFICGKKTRETGHGESDIEACAFCYDALAPDGQSCRTILRDIEERTLQCWDCDTWFPAEQLEEIDLDALCKKCVQKRLDADRDPEGGAA